MKAESEGMSDVKRAGNVGRRSGDDESLLLVDARPVDFAVVVARDDGGLGVKVRVFGRRLRGEGRDEVGRLLPPGVPRLLDVGRVVASRHWVGKVCARQKVSLAGRS